MDLSKQALQYYIDGRNVVMKKKNIGNLKEDCIMQSTKEKNLFINFAGT
jgi:hypothetical protein